MNGSVFEELIWNTTQTFLLKRKEGRIVVYIISLVGIFDHCRH